MRFRTLTAFPALSSSHAKSVPIFQPLFLQPVSHKGMDDVELLFFGALGFYTPRSITVVYRGCLKAENNVKKNYLYCLFWFWLDAFFIGSGPCLQKFPNATGSNWCSHLRDENNTIFRVLGGAL